MRLQVRSLALLSGLRIRVAVSCGAGHRLGLDPVLLWLWCRPAATALIGPLAWEPPYVAGAALKKTKNKTSCQADLKTAHLQGFSASRVLPPNKQRTLRPQTAIQTHILADKI